MTSDQKLHRALTKLIYEYFEDSYKEYAEDVYDGEYEDGLLSCIYKLERIAKRYHKDKTNDRGK